ncbi:N,N'-diacetylchitobiase precursor [Poriferisphaera corsica]|uniref:N,N'-diacetylchitobiase n=1 Tax=Poriferisphaera corsica TaxID=2528020 RepID=A0A517YYG6_9BACT|nr:glycoside hydrolase family 20 zincin-like fold domain-containing protein [Poriferisphaera corsica]QDU35258.1 N,N'-diacetylchitobiase precursor [Poriferisphaera corsica]
MILVPMPREMKCVEGVLKVGGKLAVTYEGLSPAFAERAKAVAFDAVAAACDKDVQDEVKVALKVDAAKIENNQGYELVISKDGIKVVGGGDAGVFYGLMTVKQIARQSKGGLDYVSIQDWPDFEHRGVMMDISRDKVPTMETLRMLVEMFAELKINEVQLYMEHTYAYEGYEVVWEEASPMTPEECKELDGWCQDYFIDLVPNQNTFGHMERWCKHEPYRQYAEAPDGFWRDELKEPWWVANPVSLCPTDDRAISLLDDMFGKLLPSFTSGTFNIGMDETFDLGKVRTKEICAEKGKGRVYLDYLLKVYDLAANKYGKKVQFWADILLHYPELVNDLPKDIVAMNWGYEDDHPFEKECKILGESGRPFYVCPSTCTFLCVTGRTENTMANQRNAAYYGKLNGAIGYLNTDWGDNGHWQPLTVSLPGYMYGAAVSWSLDTNRELDIAKAMDEHVFMDSAGVMGKTVMKAGSMPVQVAKVSKNCLGWLMQRLENKYLGDQMFKMPWFNIGPINEENLSEAETIMDEVIAELDQVKMDRADADQVVREMKLGCELIKISVHLNKARVAEDVASYDLLSEAKRKELAAELKAYIGPYRESWLKRNREGGLKDSAGRFETILKMLENAEPYVLPKPAFEIAK